MMDTVLNIGLNDGLSWGWSSQSGNERFAWDSYRRLPPCSARRCSASGEAFRGRDRPPEGSQRVATDLDLAADDLRGLVAGLQGGRPRARRS